MKPTKPIHGEMHRGDPNLILDDWLMGVKSSDADLLPAPWAIGVKKAKTPAALTTIFMFSQDNKVVFAEMSYRAHEQIAIDECVRQFSAICYMRNNFARLLAVSDVLRIQQAMKIPWEDVIKEVARQVTLPLTAFPYALRKK